MRLREVLPVLQLDADTAHKLGLKFVTYGNFYHRLDEVLVEHPEWRELDASGKPSNSNPCFSSPWVDAFEKRLVGLLRESPFRWGQNYPKKDDCVWTFEGATEGSRAIREPPRFQGSGQFRDAAPLFAQTQAEETPRQDAPGRSKDVG